MYWSCSCMKLLIFSTKSFLKDVPLSMQHPQAVHKTTSNWRLPSWCCFVRQRSLCRPLLMTPRGFSLHALFLLLSHHVGEEDLIRFARILGFLEMLRWTRGLIWNTDLGCIKKKNFYEYCHLFDFQLKACLLCIWKAIPLNILNICTIRVETIINSRD